MTSVYFSFILVCIALHGSTMTAFRPQPMVRINKCCRIGEYLDHNEICVAGTTEKWAPLVFMIQKKTSFHPRGEFPKFFKVQENQFPKLCVQKESFFSDIAIFSNGSLFIYEKKTSVAPENYCADRDSAIVCFPSNSSMLPTEDRKIEVKKCCGPNSAYNVYNKTCELFNVTQLYYEDVATSEKIRTIYGFPECKQNYGLAGKFELYMLDDSSGNLMFNDETIFKSKEYCLEYTISLKGNDENNLKSTTVGIFTCLENLTNLVSKNTENIKDIRFPLYTIGLFISAFFLLGTIITGCLMPFNHHLLHWRCQTYYIFCLMIGYFLLGMSQLLTLYMQGLLCISIAICMHFFFLSAFFWLNSMCFNIWWTFRDFRPSSLEKNQELLRLRAYQLYAWGLPLVIVSVGAVLDRIEYNADSYLIRPRFDTNNCWFRGESDILTYFFGPIGLLLCINLLLFASTARQLTCGLWKLEDIKSSTEKTVLGNVCIKLVVVMGISWIMDVVSWVVGGPNYLWYFTDLINALQGVFIFVVVGCQPQICASIKRIGTAKSKACTTIVTNGPHCSSSSHGLPTVADNTITNLTLIEKAPLETLC